MEFDLSSGETVELPNAADWIDPVVVDNETTTRFAVFDNDPWVRTNFLIMYNSFRATGNTFITAMTQVS